METVVIMTLWEKLKNFVGKSKFKGFFDHYGTKGKKKTYFLLESDWSSRYKTYESWLIEYPEIKSMLLTVAGQGIADGVFLESAGDYPRAEEAKEWCEELNRKIGLDLIIYNTLYAMAGYGTQFLEKTWTPEYDVRVVPGQQFIVPLEREPTGEVTSWRQVIKGKEVARWNSDEIIVLNWNEGRFSPYGTSLMDGLDIYLEGLHDILANTTEYMKKTAWPGNLFRVGGPVDDGGIPQESEVQTITSKMKNFQPGDNYVTSYKIDHKVVGPASAEPRMLPDVLTFYKTGLVDGTMTVPVSFQYQRSLASAEEMGRQERANLILPMQRIVKRFVERQIYWPYLENNGFSFRVVPSLSFESPEAHRDEDAAYFSTLVQAEIISPKTAASELGYEKQYKEWEVEKKREQQQMMKQQQLMQREEEKESDEMKDKTVGKSYVVTELNKRR